MILIPLQQFGLGDVLYCQTLIRNLMEKGDKVLWPVLPQFVEGLNRAFPDMTFIPGDITSINFEDQRDYVSGECRYIPIRWADTIRKVPYRMCMRSKYDMYGMDHEKWMEKGMWVRDTKREMLLYESLIPANGRYNLVNKYFGTHSQFRYDRCRDDMVIENNLPDIEMKSIPGFSLMDWALVIQNAETIHTVSTSIIYILEQLELNAKEVDLYTRIPIETNFENIDYILKKHKYNLHL